MLGTPEKILSSFLHKQSLNVSKKLLTQQLLGHPHYPSLLSITDTLDYLGIKNIAAEGNKDHLRELTTPFLAHLKTNGGEFVIVEDVNAIEETHPYFFDKWSGAVLSIEKPVRWHHEENDRLLKQEDKRKNERGIAFSILIVFTVVSSILSERWLLATLIIIGAIGVFNSMLIALEELGIENEVVDKVCGKNANCKTVIKSKALRLPFGIGLSDLNIIWFSSLLLGLILSSFTSSTDSLISVVFLLTLLTLPATVYSIYYQWRVAKTWCRLCLTSVTLLWLQFLVLWILPVSSKWQNIEVQSVLFIIALLSMTSIVWLFIKSLIRQNREMQDQLLAAARFKGNEAVFASLLERQRKVDATPWEDDLQIGNANAPFQITVVCNPYCKPCAVAHEKLNDLLDRYENEIGVTVRFLAKADDHESKHTKAVAHIVTHLKETLTGKSVAQKNIYTREVLHQWFQWMDLEKFAKKYPVTTAADMHEVLSMHEAWANRSKIAFTPTLFINGYELPVFYNADDLNRLVRGILGNIEVEENTMSENMAVA